MQDGRTVIRHGNQVFEFPGYNSRAEWEVRKAHLRQRILVSNGLWPWPERYALNPHLTNKIEYDDYSIENIYFESYPGFFVTGNLYRPKNISGRLPAILCPHGHWQHGRFENTDLSSIPGRCINFARQGYIAFAYDMVGYSDSRLQVPHGKGDDLRSGFFDDRRAYLWGVSLMGLQLWNSIRALDFLTTLPEIDTGRIGCTGASGGGTQTFMLSAIDERVYVSAPVNMISAHMQGGCLCENAPNLRLDAFNVEFAAMMAPRPMLMVSATGDWTKNTPAVEYPAVRSIYALYGAVDKVASVQVDTGHNYNKESREAVYAWLGKWLLGKENSEELREQPFTVPAQKSMRVFPTGKLPAHAITGKRLICNLCHDAASQVARLRPTDAVSLEAYRQIFGTCYRYALNAEQPQTCDLSVNNIGQKNIAGYAIEHLSIGRKSMTECLPAYYFSAKHPKGTVLLIHKDGKDALFAGDAQQHLAALLEENLSVLSVDLFGTGESIALRRDEKIDHFLTFNRTDVALQVQDILTALAYLRTRAQTIHLIGLGEAGLLTLLARGLASGVATTIADASQFDCTDDQAWLKLLFLPQIRRAGDFFTTAALTAPGRLRIHNAAASFPTAWYYDVYKAAGVVNNVEIIPELTSIDILLHALV